MLSSKYEIPSSSTTARDPPGLGTLDESVTTSIVLYQDELNIHLF